MHSAVKHILFYDLWNKMGAVIPQNRIKRNCSGLLRCAYAYQLNELGQMLSAQTQLLLSFLSGLMPLYYLFLCVLFFFFVCIGTNSGESITLTQACFVSGLVS